jgi:hypothetical protein
MTEWRDIPGHEGYQVSDDGRVRSLDRVIMRSNGLPQTLKGRLLKLGPNGNGRLRVQLDRPKNYQVPSPGDARLRGTVPGWHGGLPQRW